MRLFLDTNAYTAFKRGHEEVVALVREAEGLFLSTVVIGELMYGFHHGGRYLKNRRELEQLLASPFVSVIPVTRDTADRFGAIAASLRRRGRPLPTNDIWIAAHAMQMESDLLTFDRHFEEIDGLRLLHLPS